jgi:ribosomal protein L40E
MHQDTTLEETRLQKLSRVRAHVLAKVIDAALPTKTCRNCGCDHHEVGTRCRKCEVEKLQRQPYGVNYARGDEIVRKFDELLNELSKEDIFTLAERRRAVARIRDRCLDECDLIRKLA